MRIDLPAEMSSSAVRMIFRALGDGNVRFVGGCVRNALLGEAVGDLDLATTLLPGDVVERLEETGIKVIPTGIQHGTVTAVSGRQSFEITTLRIDKRADGRHAEVEFCEDWLADARRRDFTINALYADIEGNIYDPLGCGASDLARRRVVFVGDAGIRICEDYLRILRFFRFSLYYASGRMDCDGLAACRMYARRIGQLSRERVTQEFFKILSHQACAPVLGAMREAGILSGLFASDFNTKRFGIVVSLPEVPEGGGLDAVLMFRLFLLCGGGARGWKKVFNSLILSRKQKQIFEKIMTLKINTKRIGVLFVQRLLIEEGSGFVCLVLALAVARDRISEKEFHVLCDKIFAHPVPKFPVEASDLMALGYYGAALGEALSKVKRRWIRSGFVMSREQLLKGFG